MLQETQTLQRGAWSEDEHRRFITAMQQFPKGPWKAIAECVATRSVRQVQTHAQQHHEKSARKVLGLQRERKRPASIVTATVTVQHLQSEPEDLVATSELVSLWRQLNAQRETDDILALGLKSRRPNRTTSSEDSASQSDN